MGTVERKEREKKEKIQLILDAALKLFLEHGYENVTIRKIAESIEYSPAAIYLYFKNRGEIFYKLQQQAFAKFFETQKEVMAINDPLERLREHGKIYIKYAFENPEHYDLMFIMKEPLKYITSLEEWQTSKDSYDLLRQNVKSCIDEGLIKAGDVETASFALWSFVHGISCLKIRRGMFMPEEYLQELVNGAIDFVISGIKKQF